MNRPKLSSSSLLQSGITANSKHSIIAVHGPNPANGDKENNAWNTWRKPGTDCQRQSMTERLVSIHRNKINSLLLFFLRFQKAQSSVSVHQMYALELTRISLHCLLVTWEVVIDCLKCLRLAKWSSRPYPSPF